MEHNCPNCGARVEDGTPFCPKCDTPQIRVSGNKDENDAATPPLPPGTPGEVQPPAEPVRLQPRSDWQPQPIISAPLPGGVDWKIARRVAILAGVIGVIGSLFGIIAFLWVFAVGGISITLYQRRVPRSHISAGNGFRIGAFTGLITGVISGILNVLPMLSAQGRSLYREKIGQQAASAIASNPDPMAQQMVRSLTDFVSTNVGLVTLMAVGIFVMTLLFIILAGLGGSIGASLFGKHRDA